MAYFETKEPKKIELPSNKDYWVEIKTDLKYGDVKSFISVSADGSVNQAEAVDSFLRTVIVSWNLDDGNGKVAPIDEEHINGLSQADAIAIINEAGAIVKGDEENKADFLDKSEASSTPDK